jgi:uncharacterized protein YqfA (UPF0365 family)
MFPYVIVPAILVVLFSLLFLGKCVYWWLAARSVSPPLGFRRIAQMTFLGADPAVVVPAYVRASRWGLQLDVDHCRAHRLAGGHLQGLIEALLMARRFGLGLAFERAAAIDLAGEDVVETVDRATRVEQIDIGSTMPEGDRDIECTTSDGIGIVWLVATASVRLNLERVVGGSAIETLATRLVEAIQDYAPSHISSVPGTAEEHEQLRQKVLSLGLESGTAYHMEDLVLRRA